MKTIDQSVDAKLVASAKKGDVDAYAELYSRYADPIYRYACARGLAATEAEDLVSTVFLRAFEALPRYRERGWPFSAFLYRIARNALVDEIRRQRPLASEDDAEQKQDGSEAVDDAVIRREQLATVQTALARLPEDYQEVIRLRLLLDLPTATAAAWMERKEGAIRVLLHRALKALRVEMDESHE